MIDPALHPVPDLAPPVKRRPDWGSVWRLLVIQTQNAFNDKVAQFTLLGLAKVWLEKASSDRYAHVVSVLLVAPLLFFAPVAGWLSDRFSKRNIVLWCSVSQAAALVAIAAAFWLGMFWTATALFFLLALQAAIFQPAKSGVIKEYVGERHLSAASGWAQMTAITALVAGQWVGGRAYEFFHEGGAGRAHDAWAACMPTLLLAALSLGPVFLATRMKPTAEHCGERFRGGMLIEHFSHLKDLLRVRRLRLSALGVSFFWFAATLLTLILIQLGTEMEPNEASQAERGGLLLIFVGAGVAAGSVLTALISRHRIELGLVPLGGLGMAAASAFALGVEPGGAWFRFLMFCIGACSAVYLVPLNAYLQNILEPQVRGRMLSAAGLLDSLAMILSIGVQLLWLKTGVSVGWQIMMMGLLCLVTSIYVLRIIPQNFLRFTILGLMRMFYRIQPVGTRHLPETGGALIISNHVSYADAFLLSAASEREVRFTAYEAFFSRPVMGIGMRLFRVVPISAKRAKDAIVTMADAVKGGDFVCIFPEGQLTRTGMMNEVRKGFELIARRAAAPVIPVFLDDVWGSLFSFQGGRFFRKRPHHFPWHHAALWGEPCPAEQASAEWARGAFRRLAGQGLAARPEIGKSLRLSLAGALTRSPWSVAVTDGKDWFSRGILFAHATQLARRWRDFPFRRVAVALPDGPAAVLAQLALKFAGKTPVILPPALLEHPGLPALLAAEEIDSVVSASACRADHPRAAWPDHFLYLNAELEDIDDLRVGRDLLFSAPGMGRPLRWYIERLAEGDGTAWIRDTGDGLKFTTLTDREILLQTAMLRGTDLLRGDDRFLSALPLASAAGQLALHACLLGGLPLLLAGEHADPDHNTRIARDFVPTLAAGGPALAAALEDLVAPLRVWLDWTADSGLTTAEIHGAPRCPAWIDEASALLLAVSLPDPPLATATAEPQLGGRPGSPGRVPQAMLVDAAESGGLTLSLPGGRGVTLPDARIDELGFLFRNP